jgi:hypothetical protein
MKPQNKFSSYSPGYAEYTKLKKRKAIIASSNTSQSLNYGLRQIENKSLGTESISLVLIQSGLDMYQTK